MGAAYSVLVISLIPTLVAYQRVRDDARTRDQDRFDQIARAKHDALDRRLVRYLDEIVSIGGFFTANEALEVAEWNRFVRSVSAAERFPGLHALGFMELVPAAQRVAHETKWRVQNGAAYTVRPPGERPVYCPVVLLGSSGSAPRTLPGLDAFTDEVLLPTLDVARDTGSVVLSPPGTQIAGTNRSNGRVLIVQIGRAHV